MEIRKPQSFNIDQLVCADEGIQRFERILTPEDFDPEQMNDGAPWIMTGSDKDPQIYWSPGYQRAPPQSIFYTVNIGNTLQDRGIIAPNQRSISQIRLGSETTVTPVSNNLIQLPMGDIMLIYRISASQIQVFTSLSSGPGDTSKPQKENYRSLLIPIRDLNELLKTRRNHRIPSWDDAGISTNLIQKMEHTLRVSSK